jgi:hypothetical protein
MVNSKNIAKLVSLWNDKAISLRSLRGILKGIGDVSLNSIREERLAKYDKGID